MPSASVLSERREKSVEFLTKFLKSGDTVYTVLLHQTDSGRKCFRFYVIAQTEHNGEKPYIQGITSRVCDVLGFTWNRKHEGLWSRNWDRDIVQLLSEELFGGSYNSLKCERL
jgi:hypothetical protein